MYIKQIVLSSIVFKYIVSYFPLLRMPECGIYADKGIYINYAIQLHSFKWAMSYLHKVYQIALKCVQWVFGSLTNH